MKCGLIDEMFASGAWDGSVLIWKCSAVRSPATILRLSIPFQIVSFGIPSILLHLSYSLTFFRTLSHYSVGSSSSLPDSLFVSSEESVTMYEYDVNEGKRRAQFASKGGKIIKIVTFYFIFSFKLRF